ncbi:MAG: response regulator [Vicinamibacterales bacterium]
MSPLSLRRGPAATPRLAVTPAPRRAPGAVAAPVTATLVLVEDDPEIRALFAGFLAHAGYDVIDVPDAAEALLVLRDRHAQVDLLITDVVLPHVDGPSLVAAVRERHPDVRVLYVSGFEVDIETEPAAAGGPATRHVRKPITRSALLAEVAALLAPAPPEPARREIASEFD